MNLEAFTRKCQQLLAQFGDVEVRIYRGDDSGTSYAPAAEPTEEYVGSNKFEIIIYPSDE